MDKKAITLQQLEEALRDLTRWIRDKLKDYMAEPTAEGESGWVLTTNGIGGRSWEPIDGLETDSTLSVEGAAADAAAAGAAIAAAQAAAEAAGEAADKAQAAAEAAVTTEKIADRAVTGDKLAAEVYGRFSAYNLLDNSDFSNPVNQRGETSYTTSGYTIDRWLTPTGSTTLTVNDSGVTISDGYFVQRIETKKIAHLSTLTFAMRLSNGLYMGSADISGAAVGNVANFYADATITLNAYRESEDVWEFYILSFETSPITIKWAALYEGEYTADTLPEYQPKGYGVELAECMRYYQNISSTDVMLLGFSYSTTIVRFQLPLLAPLRTADGFTPTFTYGSISWLRCASNNTENPSSSLNSLYYRGNTVDVNIAFSSVTSLQPYSAQFSGGVSISADL